MKSNPNQEVKPKVGLRPKLPASSKLVNVLEPLLHQPAFSLVLAH